jgi:DNA polymerase-3 subunit delta'
LEHLDLTRIEWNSTIREQLLGRGLEHVPHAILLVGPAGVGKTVVAEQLARLLLCESIAPDLTACGACQACTWLDAGNHLDFRRVEPEGDEETEEGASEKAGDKARKRSQRIIRIDQIRELEPFVFVGSHRDGNRVALIAEAETMNPAAANALLKILEEPPTNVYFILISSNQKSLLPTIRSRCRVIAFGAPDARAATAWLAGAGLERQVARYLNLAGGAPMRVAQWHEQGHLAPIDALVDSLISAPADPIALAARHPLNQLLFLEDLAARFLRGLRPAG